ncbi:MAG: hypothetical protein ACRDRK_11055 [Pseudonocardia sp.]
MVGTPTGEFSGPMLLGLLVGGVARLDFGQSAARADDGVGGFVRGRDPYDVLGCLGRLARRGLAQGHCCVGAEGAG